MPKEITLYTIFIASPNDVLNEREIISKIVDEINLTTAKNFKIKLELKRWETDVYPNLGDSPQDVINEQIDDDYDIFIGILWSRFGTKTKTAGSGTEEEFNRSYAKWEADKKRTKVLFYFKNEPIPFEQINTVQIDSIRKFKEKLNDKALYFEFIATNNFGDLLRIHLNKAITDLINNNSQKIEIKKPEIEISEEKGEIEETGLLENIELVQTKFYSSKISLENITGYIKELSMNINEKTTQLNKLSSASNEVKIREQKRIIDNLAEDMLNFVKRTDTEIVIYKDLYDEGFKALSNAYSLSLSLGQDDIEGIEAIKNSISILENGLTSGLTGMNNFYNSVNSTTSMTTAYGKAKRKILVTLQTIIKEFNYSLHLVEEFVKNLALT